MAGLRPASVAILLLYFSQVSTREIDVIMSKRDCNNGTSHFLITDGEVTISANGFNAQPLILICDLALNGVAPEEWMLEAESKQFKIDINKWRDVQDTCRDLHKVELWLSKHEIGQRRQHRRERRQIATTVRPTYVPEGNKLGNLLIYNGTIWCGTGNKATSFDDLGVHREADECCRAHDYCPYFIPQFATKHNYTNSRPYTISSCTCDYDFFQCLRAANTTVANEVAALFFGTLSVPCFNFEYGKFCADETNFFFCNKYAYGEAAYVNYAIANIWETTKARVSIP